MDAWRWRTNGLQNPRQYERQLACKYGIVRFSYLFLSILLVRAYQNVCKVDNAISINFWIIGCMHATLASKAMRRTELTPCVIHPAEEHHPNNAILAQQPSKYSQRDYLFWASTFRIFIQLWYKADLGSKVVRKIENSSSILWLPNKFATLYQITVHLALGP